MSNRARLYEEAMLQTKVLQDYLNSKEQKEVDPKGAFTRLLDEKLSKLHKDPNETNLNWRARAVDQDGVNTREEVGWLRPSPEDLLKAYIQGGLHSDVLLVDEYDEDTFGEEAVAYRAREADDDGINTKEEVGSLGHTPAEWLEFYLKQSERQMQKNKQQSEGDRQRLRQSRTPSTDDILRSLEEEARTSRELLARFPGGKDGVEYCIHLLQAVLGPNAFKKDQKAAEKPSLDTCIKKKVSISWTDDLPAANSASKTNNASSDNKGQTSDSVFSNGLELPQYSQWGMDAAIRGAKEAKVIWKQLQRQHGVRLDS